MVCCMEVDGLLLGDSFYYAASVERRCIGTLCKHIKKKKKSVFDPQVSRI